MTLNVIVGDACPAADNINVCAALPGDKTDGHCCDASEEYTYNHFDVWSYPLSPDKKQEAIIACNTKRGSEVGPMSDYPNWTTLSNKWEGVYGKSVPAGAPNWPITFKSITCPQNITDIMKKYKCKTC
jgi:hypothetical protein